MTDLTQRARDVAGRLLTSTKGEDAADDCTIDEAAAIISELVERIEGIEAEVSAAESDLDGLWYEMKYPRD